MHSNNPYCAYHYHEINSSLCASATCGQPIEGPCAVSFDGKRRFHLEHFRCEWEYESPQLYTSGFDTDQDKDKTHEREVCNTLLKECYWEVEGKVFCERHAVESGAVTTPEREASWTSVDFHELYGNGRIGSEADDDDERNKESPGAGALNSSNPSGGINGIGMTKAQKRTTRYMDLANNRF